MTADFKVKAVIPASGTGTRFGGKTPKQFLPICGEPILKRTLEVYESCSFVDEIAVSVPEGYIEQVRGYGFNKLKHVVKGMSARADSVFAALKAIDPFDGVVLVHDGVRLFVTEELIKSVACEAYEHGAAIAAVPILETVKLADKNGLVADTPDRKMLWRAQTPQGFRYGMILRAYEQAAKDGVLHEATDDSYLVERLGLPVRLVEGDVLNMKITSKQDFLLAEALIISKDKGRI